MWRKIYRLPKKVVKVEPKLPKKQTKVSESVGNVMEDITQGEVSFNDKLYDYISQWEWKFQYKSFCDSYYKTNNKLIRHSPENCTRWSIWYWTISHQWEIITYGEWIDRRNRYIDNIIPYVDQNCFTDNEKIAILDFMYQMWSNRSNIKYYVSMCDKEQIKWIMINFRDIARSKNQSWLEKRYQARINLFLL